MLRRTRTEQELVEALWWWRHCRFATPPDSLNMGCAPNQSEWRDWKDGMERIAQEWELIRRVRLDLCWPPFYEVSSHITRNLMIRVATPSTRWPKKITTEPSPQGWTDPDADGWRYNFDCTKDSLRRDYAARLLPTEPELSAVFHGQLSADDLARRLAKRRKELPTIAEHLRWIERQAKSKGFELRRGLIRQRNRSVSWAWVEVLDIARYVATRQNPLRKLSSAERKMKTLATRAAKRLLPIYSEALTEISMLPGFLSTQTPEHIARQRKIILGHWTPKTNW